MSCKKIELASLAATSYVYIGGYRCNYVAQNTNFNIELTLSMVIVKESESGGIGGGLLSPPRRLSKVAP